MYFAFVTLSASLLGLILTMQKMSELSRYIDAENSNVYQGVGLKVHHPRVSGYMYLPIEVIAKLPVREHSPP